MHAVKFNVSHMNICSSCLMHKSLHQQIFIISIVKYTHPIVRLSLNSGYEIDLDDPPHPHPQWCIGTDEMEVFCVQSDTVTVISLYSEPKELLVLIERSSV